MKTSMQELIDDIQSLKELDAVINPIDVITHIVKMKLEKERQMVIDAYNRGNTDGYTDGFYKLNSKPNAEQYFELTYNTPKQNGN